MGVWKKIDPPSFNDDEKFVQVKKVITRHEIRRATSEIALEKELTWHFEKGACYHCFSWGDVDSLSYFRCIVKQQLIHYALVSTWCMAETDIKEIFSWIEKGYIGRVDFYVGEIFKGSYEKEYRLLVELCAKYSCRLVIFRNHSKVMVLLGEKFDAAIESSANVNTNPRSEQTVITVDSDLAFWYKDIFDNITPFNSEFQQPPIFKLRKE